MRNLIFAFALLAATSATLADSFPQGLGRPGLKYDPSPVARTPAQSLVGCRDISSSVVTPDFIAKVNQLFIGEYGRPLASFTPFPNKLSVEECEPFYVVSTVGAVGRLGRTQRVLFPRTHIPGGEFPEGDMSVYLFLYYRDVAGRTFIAN
jgi:hypothetical protein